MGMTRKQRGTIGAYSRKHGKGIGVEGILWGRRLEPHQLHIKQLQRAQVDLLQRVEGYRRRERPAP